MYFCPRSPPVPVLSRLARARRAASAAIRCSCCSEAACCACAQEKITARISRSDCGPGILHASMNSRDSVSADPGVTCSQTRMASRCTSVSHSNWPWPLAMMVAMAAWQARMTASAAQLREVPSRCAMAMPVRAVRMAPGILTARTCFGSAAMAGRRQDGCDRGLNAGGTAGEPADGLGAVVADHLADLPVIAAGRRTAVSVDLLFVTAVAPDNRDFAYLCRHSVPSARRLLHRSNMLHRGAGGSTAGDLRKLPNIRRSPGKHSAS